MVEGPFGPRPVVYADYTASGRALQFLEDHLREVVLPLYANTHTESSGTGLQTSRFREDAREIIAECTGATDEHAVVFAGSGSTGAIAKLVGVLGLRIPSVLDDEYGFSGQVPASQRPVVFIGPFEHHSNELPWRESIADLVTIREDADGHVDLAHLEAELDRYRDRPRLIGSFSAASNVTGMRSPVTEIAKMLHRHGAFACFDYAASGPYVEIDMNPSDPDAALDAVFLSPHKFLGGPGSSGVLVFNERIYDRELPPSVSAGGTVDYVGMKDQDFISRIEEREKAGTPGVPAFSRSSTSSTKSWSVGLT